MDINKIINTYWYVDEDTEFKPVEQSLISKKEKELEVSLPSELIQILEISNTGEPAYSLYHEDEFIDTPDIDYIESYELTRHDDSDLGKFCVEWEMPEKLLLLSNESPHYMYALDYRETNENPPLIAVNDGQIEHIANTFRDYLLMLKKREQPDIDPVNKIIASGSIDAISEMVSNIGIDWKNEYGHSLCQLAAAMGANDSLKYLVSLGADIIDAEKFAEMNDRKKTVELINKLTI